MHSLSTRRLVTSGLVFALTLAVTATAAAPSLADEPSDLRRVASGDLTPLSDEERSALRAAAAVPELGTRDVLMVADQTTDERVAVAPTGQLIFGAFELDGRLRGLAKVDLAAHHDDFDDFRGIAQVAPSVYVVLAGSGVYLFMHPGTGRTEVVELDIDPAPFAYLSTAAAAGLDESQHWIVLVGDTTWALPVTVDDALWRDSSYPLAPGSASRGQVPEADASWPLVTLSIPE